MGMEALLDVAQRLGARGSSASAGGTGLNIARRGACYLYGESGIANLRNLPPALSHI